MRLAATLLIAAAFAATPVMAQATLKASDVGPNADRDLWCASAFTLTSYIAGQANDAATAATATAKMQVLYTSIVMLMKAGGYEQPQFDELNKQYSARVMNPFAPADDGYSAEACDTAATEAEASVAAAPSDAPADAPAPATP